MGVREGIDPSDLGQAGWGVILADDAEPAIEEALRPLLKRREEQAGKRYRRLTFQVGEDSKDSFLGRHGAGPGPADPDRVPYYLMIVGSPEKIPFRFQMQLDVQYAVGRIHFEAAHEYAAYAETVVLADREVPPSGRRPPPPGRLAAFGVTNPDDRHTRLAAEQLTDPLMRSLAEHYPQWMQDLLMGASASKTAFLETLRSTVPIGLLFCVSHGVVFPAGHRRQRAHQGALLCADWPGPRRWAGPLPDDFYVSADDLTGDMNLFGTIAFLYGSYGCGTPQFEELTRQEERGAPASIRREIAPAPFVARLPSQMLGRANGALAVAGLVDSGWGYSYPSDGVSRVTAGLQSAAMRLLDGYPVGWALEAFTTGYAELSSALDNELAEIRYGKTYDDLALANLWTANNDLRGYALLGDPAVRLTTTSAGRTQQAGDDRARALKYYEQALSLRHQAGDKAGEARALYNIGKVYADLGKKAEALAQYEQALALLREVGDRAGEAVLLNRIGQVHADLDDRARALEFYEQALSLRRAVGDRAGEAASLNGIGLIQADLGDKAGAFQCFEQALQLARQVGDRAGEAATLSNIGQWRSDLGDRAGALEYHARALLLRRQAGDRAGEALTLHTMAFVAYAAGRFGEAQDLFRQAIQAFRDLGATAEEAAAMADLAQILKIVPGNQAKAAQWIASSIAILEQNRLAHDAAGRTLEEKQAFLQDLEAS